MSSWPWAFSIPFTISDCLFTNYVSAAPQLFQPESIHLKWVFKWSSTSNTKFRYRLLLDGIILYSNVIDTVGVVENSVKVALTQGFRVFNFQFASSVQDSIISVEDFEIVVNEIAESK